MEKFRVSSISDLGKHLWTYYYGENKLKAMQTYFDLCESYPNIRFQVWKNASTKNHVIIAERNPYHETTPH